LRALNLVAFTIVFYWLRRIVFPIVAVEPFLTLGKASLEVFCAHIIFVFIGLTLLYNDVEQLHGLTAIVLLAVTFTGLFLLAANEVRRRTREKLQGSGKAVLGGESNGAGSTGTMMIGAAREPVHPEA
jgi:hypothetical protein